MTGQSLLLRCCVVGCLFIFIKAQKYFRIFQINYPFNNNSKQTYSVKWWSNNGRTKKLIYPHRLHHIWQWKRYGSVTCLSQLSNASLVWLVCTDHLPDTSSCHCWSWQCDSWNQSFNWTIISVTHTHILIFTWFTWYLLLKSLWSF